MPPNPYTFTLAQGFKIGRRAIGFLEDGGRALNARAKFNGLNAAKKRLVSDRFDVWLDGKHYPKYFHGWPDSPFYKDCFVFKWRENRVEQRLYGFLCNPRPRTDSGFRLCALAIHATKTEWETDESELDRIVSLLYAEEVKAAIRERYPEYGRE